MISSQKKAKLLWRSRRGMLELDLIFENFLKKSIETLTNEQADAYECFLNHADPDLYAWLMGYQTPSDKETADFVAFIRDV